VLCCSPLISSAPLRGQAMLDTVRQWQLDWRKGELTQCAVEVPFCTAARSFRSSGWAILPGTYVLTLSPNILDKSRFNSCIHV
jgi:hypothetical protein